MENERMQNVFNWYNENKESDPNMFELVEVLSQVSRSETKNFDLVSALTGLEIGRLFSNGIVLSEEDSLVQLIQEIRQKVLEGKVISQETEDFTKSLAGVTFYIKTQESRQTEGNHFVYDNTDEYIRLLDMKDKVVDSGEDYTETMRNNIDYIAVHYKNNQRTMPTRHTMEGRANDRSDSSEAKVLYMISEVEPYVYPERVPELIEYCQTNYLLPIDTALEIIRELAINPDFDAVMENLDNRNLSSLGWRNVLGAALMFAKNGPDFFLYAMDKKGISVLKENEEYASRRKEENLKLEENNHSDSKNHMM